VLRPPHLADFFQFSVFRFRFCVLSGVFLDLRVFIDTTIDHIFCRTFFLPYLSIPCYKNLLLAEKPSQNYLPLTTSRSFSRVNPDWTGLAPFASQDMSCHVAIPRNHTIHDEQIKIISRRSSHSLTPHVRPIHRSQDKKNDLIQFSVHRALELSSRDDTSRSLLANLHVSVSARRSTDPDKKENVAAPELGEVWRVRLWIWRG
jgi:hypothetical protein